MAQLLIRYRACLGKIEITWTFSWWQLLFPGAMGRAAPWTWGLDCLTGQPPCSLAVMRTRNSVRRSKDLTTTWWASCLWVARQSAPNWARVPSPFVEGFLPHGRILQQPLFSSVTPIHHRSKLQRSVTSCSAANAKKPPRNLGACPPLLRRAQLAASADLDRETHHAVLGRNIRPCMV